MIRHNFIIPYITLILFFLTACNKDEVIMQDSGNKPEIILENISGIYSVKKGKSLLISPEYKNAENAIYRWEADGELLSREPVFEYVWHESATVYLTLTVETSNGSAKEEMRIDILDLLPPAIDIYLPENGLKILVDSEYNFTPEFSNVEDGEFSVKWIVNNEEVSSDITFLFKENIPGIYEFTIIAENEDGVTNKDFEVEVVESLPYAVKFPLPYYMASTTDRFTYEGRSVYLTPLLEYFSTPVYSWSVNNEKQECEDKTFIFTPEKPGTYEVVLSVTEESTGASVSSTVNVVCVPGDEIFHKKNISASSSLFSNKVFEYLPAPGQYINEKTGGGFKGNEYTFESAAKYAETRLENELYVSLGSFGGYIIVGFDHSIANNGQTSGEKYDFIIGGNALTESSEPGIVWVMQDVNGNGLPDDEWYELKGSEWQNPQTIYNYEVTYYRPSASHGNVRWFDMSGQTGTIDYNSYHDQDSYYPLWMNKECYTLRGTKLRSTSYQEPSTGFWTNKSFEWGYADNNGSDTLTPGDQNGTGHKTGFFISNAIYPDGTPVNLEYIDFIKVQSSQLSKAGWLGEISTEVFFFKDMN